MGFPEAPWSKFVELRFFNHNNYSFLEMINLPPVVYLELFILSFVGFLWLYLFIRQNMVHEKYIFFGTLGLFSAYLFYKMFHLMIDIF